MVIGIDLDDALRRLDTPDAEIIQNAMNFSTLHPNAPPPAPDTWGVEVTVPAQAAACAVNLDPQHGTGHGGNVPAAWGPHQGAVTTAIEAATECDLPPADATLVTTRPDLDSVGAMAVLYLRHNGRYANIDRVLEIVKADTGPDPSVEWRPRPLSAAIDHSVTDIHALAAFVSDRTGALERRVHHCAEWLAGGTFPDLLNYGRIVRRQRDAIEEALESRETMVRLTPCRRVAVVYSTLRQATSIGYHVAPVVVALNPEYLPPGDPCGAIRKATICQWRPGLVDLSKVTRYLSKLIPPREAGWGGTATIIGSPQAEGTQFPLREIVSIVCQHLASDYTSPPAGDPDPLLHHGPMGPEMLPVGYTLGSPDFADEWVPPYGADGSIDGAWETIVGAEIGWRQAWETAFAAGQDAAYREIQR